MCKAFKPNSAVQFVYSDSAQPLAKELQKSLQHKAEILLAALGQASAGVVLFLCDAQTMQNLNHQFRNKNAPTDVLAFEDRPEDFEQLWREQLPFGEIALCLTVCEDQAKKYGWSFEQELLRLLVHGLAHLAGYTHDQEHEKAMRKKELELWQCLYPNPKDHKPLTSTWRI